MSKHSKSEGAHDAFKQLVEGVLDAEGESDRVKSGYESKVAELLKKGKEKSVEMEESYSKKAAEVKNKVLASERQKTEKITDEIISDAKKQANTLRGKKLNREEINEIFENFSSSL